MSSKKIIIINGSPRKKGNTALLIQRAEEGIKAVGAEVETFYIQGMNIKACTACDACRNGKTGDKYCIIDDDMQTIYEKLIEADGIIMAGPIYWFNVSAQTKLVMDRWYALKKQEGYILKGKTAGVMLVYGDSDPRAAGTFNAINTFKDAFGYLNVNIAGIIHGSAYEAGEIASNKELMDSAFELGKTMGT